MQDAIEACKIANVKAKELDKLPAWKSDTIAINTSDDLRKIKGPAATVKAVEQCAPW